MQWFRLHHKLLNDPAVQGLSSDHFKIYINVLCFASSLDRGGYIGTLNETSFALRETKENVSSCFIALQGVGLIVTNETDGETFQVPQWRKKQYESDTSTSRVKKHREKRKRSKTVTETAPDTDTDTETEQKQKVPASGLASPSDVEKIAKVYLKKGDQLRFIKAVGSKVENSIQLETLSDAIERLSIKYDNQPLRATDAIPYCSAALGAPKL